MIVAHSILEPWFEAECLASAQKLVVEIDGRYHERTRNADARRDRKLVRQWLVIAPAEPCPNTRVSTGADAARSRSNDTAKSPFKLLHEGRKSRLYCGLPTPA